MFGIENFTGFVTACVILNITPGADTVYIMTRSVAQGKRAGLVSVAGIMSGCVVHVLSAAFGLSIILSASSSLFCIVKYAGAAYLVFLGIRTICTKKRLFENEKVYFATRDLFKIYRQGVITNILNPKVGLFFISFLPQFIDPVHAQGSLPFLLLGATFLTTGTLWCLALTRMASQMTKTLRDNDYIGVMMQKISGLIFIGFGLKLAMDTIDN